MSIKFLCAECGLKMKADAAVAGNRVLNTASALAREGRLSTINLTIAHVLWRR